MDSLTQIALGAAVGEAVQGSRARWRAPLWGAICGTIPDLDVLVPFEDAVADFTYHRSFSHSLLVLALLTPLVVWLIRRLHPAQADQGPRWYALVYLSFATHVLLDSFTVYGTQIFWPLSEYPVALASIFIIDPAYTLPLALGVIGALALRHSPRGLRLNALGLALSTLYLLWGLGLKWHVESVAARSLGEQGVAYERLLAIPAPLNSLLWRVMAVSDERYHIGYYSLLDPAPVLRTTGYPSAGHLLEDLAEHWPVQRLRWFTKGFYAIEVSGRDILVSDLRMGLEPNFAFRFKVAEIGNPHPRPLSPSQKLPTIWDFERMPRVWWRIWDPNRQI